MERSEERAHFYLTKWKELMAGENPLRRIVWLSGGTQNNESMVVRHLHKLMMDVETRSSDISNMLYTNCVDVDGWPNSYVLEVSGFKDKGHMFETSVFSVDAFFHEEGLSSADLMVCNDYSASFALYAHGLGMWNFPTPPVISVLSKVPEGLYSYLPEEQAISILRYLGHNSTHWTAVADNEHEVNLLMKLMDQAGIPNRENVFKFSTYHWSPDMWVEESEKEDLVVWSGRPNSTKNPTLGADVFSLLPKIKREVFFPRPDKGAGFSQIANVVIHGGEPPDIYRKLTRKAKVLLITSNADAYPVGYLELMGQGCVPVLFGKPWNKDLIPPDWPLVFRTPGEGAEMVLYAMRNYSQYAKQLFEWMKVRYQVDHDFSENVCDIWNDYTTRLGDRIRLVGRRGSRRSL